MASEIQHDIGALLYNISTITPTKAQKRWRLAYFSIHFSNTMLSVAKMSEKVAHYPISDIVAAPAYTVIEIFPEPNNTDNYDERFSNVDPLDLTDMVKNKDLETLHKHDGVSGLAKSLHTNLEHGIISNDIESRKDAFGSNTYKKPPPKGFLYFVVEAFKDLTILLLLACATLSLGFGLKKAKEGWYAGVATCVGVFLVIAISAVSNFRQERQFDRLSKRSNNLKIDAIREGRRQKISIFDVVVGDVIILNIGDQVPADGLFINGHSLLIDESSMTGESDHIDIDAINNPFLFSGSKVADGHGQMLVISVGMNTAWGKMMNSITGDSDEQIPVRFPLSKFRTPLIAMLSLAFTLIDLATSLIRYCTGDTKDKNGNWIHNGQYMDTNDVLSCFTQGLVAIAEGLSLAVNLTHACSMNRMMADQAMVRNFSALETMGSVTVICTDKTGTLTLNEMKVIQFWHGLDQIEYNSIGLVDAKVLELYHQGVGLNTTGSVYKSAFGSAPEYSGSSTEKAILSWAVTDLGMDIEKLKQDHAILHVETFNSEKKWSGASLKKKEEGTINVHRKGAAEIVLAMCSNYYQINGHIKSITHDEKTQFENIIKGMAASSLTCIAFAHKQKPNEDGTNYNTVDEEGFTLLGIVGIEDPCRPGAWKAIDTCRSAGIDVKMITGDNVFTAKAIATECGILTANQQVSEGEVVEGEEFRNYTDKQRMNKVESIRVMARSSPSDKLLMIQCLKKMDYVVAVTGHAANDAPALKEADVGISLGIQGTEVAKESSDIIISNDDFTSIVTALKWGQSVQNNIQKFILFQLTANVVVVVINIAKSAFVGGIPLEPVQQLWVNVIINSLGALALATELPIEELMHKPPVSRVAPLITNVMWRNLLAQALYQITVLLIFQFKGKSIFNVDEKVKNTIIFNTFVLCQVFNKFNSRQLEKRNVFEGIHKSYLFLGSIGVTIILQVVMVEFLSNFADTENLDPKQWGICIAIAALSLAIGWFVKTIPVPDTPMLSYIEGWI